MFPVCRRDLCKYEAVKTAKHCLLFIAGWLQRVCQAFQVAVLPYRCLGCANFFFPKEENSDRAQATSSFGGQFKELVKPFLCGRCSHGITLLESPFCQVCGMPFSSRQGNDHTCGACLTSPKRFDLARACGRYDQGLKDLIHWFKYRNLPQLAHPLGALLAWGFKTYFKDQPIDMIVPVPLHARRMRTRGFNQAYLLARSAMINELKQNFHVLSKAYLVTTLLVRVRATPPQTGLGRELRRKNIRNAFKVTSVDAVKGKAILLVDDVYTTGATVDECTRVLKQAGARWVAVLSLARA